MIDPKLLADLRRYVCGTSGTRVNEAMAALRNHNDAWYDAAVNYGKLEQCDVSAAAKDIIWLQGYLDGQRPV